MADIIAAILYKYVVEFILGIFFGGVGIYLKKQMNKIQAKLKEQEQVKKGILALLHDRIFQSCMYSINQGEISLSALDNINEMYEAYAKLGGNGTGKEIVERTRDLHVKE